MTTDAVEVLIPPRNERSWVLKVSLVFVVLGILMILVEPYTFEGYAAVGFFGLCALVMYAKELMRERFRLELSEEGFTAHHPLSASTHKWQDVEAFAVWRHRGVSTVGWRLRHSSGGLNRAVSNLDGTLPSLYGKTPDELAAFLEERRRAAAA